MSDTRKKYVDSRTGRLEVGDEGKAAFRSKWRHQNKMAPYVGEGSPFPSKFTRTEIRRDSEFAFGSKGMTGQTHKDRVAAANRTYKKIARRDLKNKTLKELNDVTR